jgi:hypothetical protein
MQWLYNPFLLQPKGLRFDHFPKFFFSFTNEMDERKYIASRQPLGNFFKLVPQGAISLGEEDLMAT